MGLCENLCMRGPLAVVSLNPYPKTFLTSGQSVQDINQCTRNYLLPPLFIYLFIYCFLGPHPQHMEVPRLGVESELQLLAYTTASATQDLSRI